MEFKDEDVQYFADALVLVADQPYAVNKLATQLCERMGTKDPLDWLLAVTNICARYKYMTGNEAKVW